MAGGIYLVQGNDLVEMTEQRFEKEELFQILLAKYPRVLGGDQLDGTNPKRWLLITREAGIPVDQESPDRWSVDHLFVDEEAIPTFVEVKRKGDTRLRREVVGQMLDYVSHAVISWRDGRLRQYFEAECAPNDPDMELAAAIGEDKSADLFWADVDTNLRAGRVRLIFVADEFPPELSRIIEFLNEQMKLAEVLGIEVRRYVGGGLQTLVPRVIGVTAVTRETKGGGQRGPRWDEARFFEKISGSAVAVEVALARSLLEFGTQASGEDVQWGTGKERGSFTAQIIKDGERYSLFSIYTNGVYSINIGWNHGARAKTLADSFRGRCRELLGFDYDDKDTWLSPSSSTRPLSELVPDGAQRFKDLVSELAERIHALSPGSKG